MLRTPFRTLVLIGSLSLASPAFAQFKEEAVARGFFGGLPTWGAQAVDIDDDGDIDITLGHHFLVVYQYANDGTGNFATGPFPQITPADGEDRHGLLWADLSGDGLPDPLCAHGGGGGCGCPAGGNELWESQGGSSYTVVPSAGGMLDATGRGRAFSAADVDGDGDLDVYHSKAPLASSPNSLYRNDGSMTFVDVAATAGLDEQIGTVGGLFADYDDDGDPDLLVGGEEFTRSTLLFRNDAGSFVDATATAFGGALPVIAGADWGDLDNDGDLDLAICEGEDAIYDAWGTAGNDYWFFANHRLSDDGVDVFRFESVVGNPIAILEWRGTFTASRIFLGPSAVNPVNPVTPLTNDYVGMPTFTPGVDEGMYVWRDSANGPFQIWVSAPPGTFGNYSGNIFTSSGVTAMADSSLEQISVPGVGPRVYRNDGGSFVEITGALGVTGAENPRAVAWTDYDNDGDLDLHVMNKGTAEVLGQTDYLWRNDGATFAQQTGTTWVNGEPDHLTDGGVWADFTGDGWLDLLLQEGAGPDFYSTESPTYLYVNQGPAGNWLSLDLGQTLAGGTPVGAAVTAYAGGLEVHRRVEANAWRGFQEPLRLHFGLGAAVTVDSLVIAWPNASTEAIGPFAANQHVTHAEGDGVVEAPLVAGTWRAGRVFPQPAGGSTPQSLTVSAPRAGHLAVSIHDVTGRRIRDLSSREIPGGDVSLHWDGRDTAGRAVPAGVYFFRVTVDGEERLSRKAVRLR